MLRLFLRRFSDMIQELPVELSVTAAENPTQGSKGSNREGDGKVDSTDGVVPGNVPPVLQ